MIGLRGKLGFVCGLAWASCVTLPALVFLVLPAVKLGWYRYAGRYGDAWVFVLDPRHPLWLNKWRKAWFGFTVGNLVFLRESPDSGDVAARTLAHERVHVRQYMLLGPFFLPLYFFFYLVIRLFIAGGHGYYDNPFEIAARRAVGQYVDVWGAIQRLKAGVGVGPHGRRE